MIEAQRLTKRFGPLPAVDGANFEVPEGCVTGFLGPNGAGKTTTIRMITGYLQPTSGRIMVAGHDAAGAPLAVRQQLGYLQESAPLYAEMRVDEFLRFRAKLFGIVRGDRKSAIDRALGACDLQPVRRRPIHQLSKGYRQRVGLAAALLHRPALLILDEPTVGLDPTQIREVRSLVRDLAGEHTILLSTHILPEAERICDRLIVIAGGRIRAQGTLEELRAEGGRTYTVETDAASAVQRLEQLDGVAAVRTQSLDATWFRLEITGTPGADDLRGTIGALLKDAGATVRELHREAASLESMFVRLTTGEAIDFPPDDAGVARLASPAPARDEVTV